MELLVSIAVFVMLGMLLITLLRGGVDLWERGESRRDAYERSAILFDALRADITCATVHRDFDAAGIYPNFTCLPDSKGRPILFFTRVGIVPRQDPIAAPKGTVDAAATTFFAAPDTMKRHEIIYFFDPDSSRGRLYRSQFALNNDYGLKMPLDVFTRPDWIAANASLLMDGVLYLNFRFWSQKTAAWNPQQGEEGPENRWDSTRFRDREFEFCRKALKANDPLDDILPRRVEIVLTIERPTNPGSAFSKLRADIGDATTDIPADLLRTFPDGPGLAKIDDEWISYESRSGSGLSGVKRGLRGTRDEPHKAGAALRFGETFTLVVPIPAYKDDPNP